MSATRECAARSVVRIGQSSVKEMDSVHLQAPVHSLLRGGAGGHVAAVGSKRVSLRVEGLAEEGSKPRKFSRMKEIDGVFGLTPADLKECSKEGCVEKGQGTFHVSGDKVEPKADGKSLYLHGGFRVGSAVPITLGHVTTEIGNGQGMSVKSLVPVATEGCDLMKEKTFRDGCWRSWRTVV